MVTYEMISDAGNRAENEDSARVYQENGIFCAVVADGLGGHGSGADASSMVADYMIDCIKKEKKISVGSLQTYIEECQKCLLEEQKRRKKEHGMKTTLTVIAADKKHVILGHVGDSRIYHFRKGKLLEHTLDHSVPQMLVATGEITEKEIRHHPDRNRLLRSLGIEWRKPAYVLKENDYRKKDAFLLCSDGFWEWIEDDEMEQCLQNSKNVKSWLDSMITIVKEKGKDQNMDNYSAIAICL